MLSGIGPRDELEKHGIKVIKHLPGVGQTMKDHAAIFFTAREILIPHLNVQNWLTPFK